MNLVAFHDRSLYGIIQLIILYLLYVTQKNVFSELMTKSSSTLDFT